jgi:hypothetical protein
VSVCLGGDIRLYFLFFTTDSSSTETRSGSQRQYLNKEHLSYYTPRVNTRIHVLNINAKENKRGYAFPIYYKDETCTCILGGVVLYNNQWHKLKHERLTGAPFLGPRFEEADQYDLIIEETLATQPAEPASDDEAGEESEAESTASVEEPDTTTAI